MRSICFLICVSVLVSITLCAAGPANKATGDIIRGVPENPSGILTFTAHEKVEMANGKTRPAKGLVTFFNLTDSSRYWVAEVECAQVIDEVDAVFAGRFIVVSGYGFELGQYMKFWVQDYGEPGIGVDKLYTEYEREDPGNAFDFCESPPPDPTSMARRWEVHDGNIQVHYRLHE
jgi:hypothetical protein